MHHQIAASLLVASAGLSIAAPAADINKKTFQLQQVQAGQNYLSGPLSLDHAYGKYARLGAVAPADVKAAAAAAAQSGSVSANPQQVRIRRTYSLCGIIEANDNKVRRRLPVSRLCRWPDSLP